MANSRPSVQFARILVFGLASIFLSGPASAATPVEIARCYNTYSALQAPVARASHGPLAYYVSARLGNLRPPMLKLRSEGAQLDAAQVQELGDSKRIASQMAADVSVAISGADDAALQRAMAPVFACDKIFGFTSLPLPKADASSKGLSPETIPPRPKYDPSLPPDVMKSYERSFMGGCPHGPAPAKYRVQGEANSTALCQCVLDASTGPAHDRIPTFQELDEMAEKLYGNCAKSLKSPR
jgi:hypothetical protein